MDQSYEKHLGARLATIEELRRELGSEGIECPGVLVVGAQSSGKSSVLERLTDIDFPRAANTCTRVPTIVQLQKDPTVKMPTATISKDPKLQDNVTQCTSKQEIRQAILKLTQESVNETTSIRDDPIHIRYVRSEGPVMTLIDLPGITHVDVQNEGFDIHEVTAGMVSRYVDNENMIVLVVIPANDDFGNSEALRIAQMFDQEGNRTIGVISKCDHVPETSDIIQKIQMTRDSDVRLALGFIAVRNKGPGEEAIDIEKAEEDLFKTHPLLKQLKKHERGYQALSNKIVDLQSDRVSRFMPEVKTMVRNRIEEIKKDLDRIGYTPYTHSDRSNLVTKELCDMDNILYKLIRAETCKQSSTNIAARTYELSQQFAKAVRSKVPNCLTIEYAGKLRKAMKETMGFSLPNFMSDQIFRDALKEVFFVDNLAANTEMFIDDVAELMNHVFQQVIMDRKTMKQFPELARALIDQSARCIQGAQGRAKEVTGAVIEAERVQVYTQNAHYMDIIVQTKGMVLELQKKEIAKQLRSQNGTVHESELTSSSSRTSNEMGIAPGLWTLKDLSGIQKDFIAKYAKARVGDTVEQALMDLQISIHCYTDTVMRRLFDIIPMIVRSIMVHEMQTQFHCSMRSAFDEENLDNMFLEDVTILRERENLQARLTRMRSARKKLSNLH